MPAYHVYEDSELLDYMKSGNEAAFDEIYRRHWHTLYHSAYYLLQEEAPAMDIVQDVFVWFWEHRDHLVLTTLRGYLLMAVRYKVANYFRHRKVRAAFAAETVLLAREASDHEQELELKELKAMIARFTGELPERCREVFQLSRHEHLSNREIARQLGISEKTVENQLTIALKKLRVRLGSMSLLL
ncbi:RNA polymerase sigma-70 factor [Chitinophaga qingshengii]|uniref:RNA polymerase sigma-70 factor n=1 Tax=Chitinophaga qingshengii TaxID=1569794 RepID=A0ABR7TIR6_9BACT|nr:RNA polymerase sigma-70 factor [Chitinophaga qingshengii]MBC9929853.1 RNA polymerase sigma-70 factor [Chitinophaga qingshengii]